MKITEVELALNLKHISMCDLNSLVSSINLDIFYFLLFYIHITY